MVKTSFIILSGPGCISQEKSLKRTRGGQTVHKRGGQTVHKHGGQTVHKRGGQTVHKRGGQTVNKSVEDKLSINPWRTNREKRRERETERDK